MHLVRSGALEVRRTEGVERYVLARLGSGHAFGELAVLDRTPRTATVVAVEDTETVEIDAEDLDGVLAEHPEAVRRMLGVLARLLIDEKELVIRDNWMLERRVRERTQDLRSSQLEIVHRLGQVAESRDPETGRPHHPHEPRLRPPRQGDRHVAGGVRDAAARGADARHRQGRGARLDPPQARTARSTSSATACGSTPRSAPRSSPGSHSPIVQMAEEIAMTHHERWDGSGYPLGLKGEEIPLVGRICAVGDVFDALISARPYKRAWSIDEALGELQRQAGVLLDPESSPRSSACAMICRV